MITIMIQMSYYSEIIAKSSGETLSEHTRKCLDNYRLVEDQIGDKINIGLDTLEIERNYFWEHAFMSVAFHDFGKVDLSFQEMIRSGNVKKALPHALISAMEVNYNYENRKEDLLFHEIPISTLCVLSHHSMLKEKLFLNSQSNLEKLNLCNYDQFLAFVRKQYKETIGNDILISDTIVKKRDYRSTIGKIHNGIQALKTGDLKKLRYVYILMENILHICDWHASSETEFNLLPEYSDKVYNYLKSLKNFNGLNEMQKFTETNSGSYIIQSPTGSGKTEAALLWSQNNKGKLLYLLPTMNTTNKIYNRLCRVFPREYVGLLHSTSDLFLINSDSSVYDQNDFSKFYSKTFNMPIMVSTIDQLLFSMYNINRWDSITFNSLISNIVLDEVHAYDPRSLGLMIEFLNNISIFNPNILIMSATIPDSLKSFIKENCKIKFSEKEFIVKREYESRIEVFEEDILNCIPVIKQNLNYDKILLIVNTIKTARVLYDTLMKDPSINKEILLFHSQFTFEHKQMKSDKLESDNAHNIIAICTQIVEVSLDINFDFLLTEAAPPDALIQRFGRVNRYGKNQKSKIFIYRWTDNSEYVYDRKYMEKSYAYFKNIETLTDENVKEIINETYNNEEYSESLVKHLDEIRNDNKLYKNLKGIYKFEVDEFIADQHNLIRDIDYPKILCIPIKYYNQVYSTYKESRYNGWREFLKHSINVPFNNKTKPAIHGHGGGSTWNIPYFDYAYDENSGVSFEKEDIESNIY
jgi:CRISPR-associated endonuclease/helicase Cas3